MIVLTDKTVFYLREKTPKYSFIIIDFLLHAYKSIEGFVCSKLYHSNSWHIYTSEIE